MLRTPPIDKMEEGKKDTEKDPFRKSARLIRSPTSTSVSAVSVENTPEYSTTSANRVPFDLGTNTQAFQSEEVIMQPKITGSPRLELIYKMRSLEEESISQCKVVLRRMKVALQRQKNVSCDIKDGVAELAEQLDVIERYRKSWKSVETERSVPPVNVAMELSSNNTEETPLSWGKRIATSPAEGIVATCKRVREKEPNTWQVVERRRGQKPNAEDKKEVEKPKPEKEKRQRVSRMKPEAVLVNPTQGNTYADVLKNLRTKMRPNETTKVRGIRKTRTGALLVEFSKSEKIHAEFVEQLKSTLQETAVVSELKPMSTLEIRDLDSLTERKEVEDAIRGLLDKKDETIRTRLTAPDSREQIRAFVTLSAACADKLLKLERVKIGLISAKFRLCTSVKRCFRCLGVGHFRSECKGPDRSDICFRCGSPGHKSKDCADPVKCCLCADAGGNPVDHYATSKKCPENKTTVA